MTVQEEQFLHFATSIQCLRNAWSILKEIKKIKKNNEHISLINSAFQYALIEYSKPYKTSYGVLKKHRLAMNYIPEVHLALHNQIINARDQFHAHTDLTILEAKVYVKNISSGKIAGYVQNKIQGSEELHNLDSILELIEQTLDNMDTEKEKLVQDLPVND